MPLDTTLVVQAVAKLTKAFDLVIGEVPLNRKTQIALATGTGANQADRVFHDQRTLAASGSEELDLAGVLTDAFGDTVTFARIKAMIVVAASANVNNVVIGGAGANAFATWVGDATDKIVVRPGGIHVLIAPDATAYVVTAGTGDKLQIANSGGGTSVTYDIILIGASA